MSVLLEKGFFVRVPAWHGEGDVIGDYPGREEAMQRAGHDWDVIEVDSYMGIPRELALKAGVQPWEISPNGVLRKSQRTVFHLRSDNLFELAAHNKSFERIPNSLAYDVAELLFDQGFRYDAGVTLDGGRHCAITLLLDEPITIPGDDSVTLPYGVLRWAHDGSSSLHVNSGAIRVVCMNTYRASEAEGKRLGTDFTFRHTANVRQRIDEAKDTIKSVKEGFDRYREIAEELAEIPVTPDQRDWFVSTIVGDRDGAVSRGANVSDRVKDNVERERAKVNALWLKPDYERTIPESHELTAYGLFLAGGEYFDHLRNSRSKDSYVRRTLLNHSAAKSNLRRTIEEATLVA